jgi:2-methylaconitate cis-trans-isomerase PrpF
MATTRKLRAVFMRGGTSKALVFLRHDLPADEGEWPGLFLTAMGSPDPNGPQLDGMGGGVTSLSKVCVIGPPTRADADIDYSFFQVLVKEARVLTHGNCGNMSAAMGPFAVDEGLVPCAGARATVRIHNTNTRKLIHSSFAIEDGRAAVAGELEIPGVAGKGAPVRLEFLDPGGAATGRLLPTGRAVDRLEVPGLGPIEASIVDAANLCVFVAARDVGLAGTELPEALERDAATLETLRTIGACGRVAAGLATDLDAARARLPFVAVVSPPQDAPTLSGAVVPEAAADLCIRMLSSGQPHRALPGTGAIAAAVAMQVPGAIPQWLARARAGASRTLAMPSGAMTVEAVVTEGADGPVARVAVVQRTARRLFEGWVYA